MKIRFPVESVAAIAVIFSAAFSWSLHAQPSMMWLSAPDGVFKKDKPVQLNLMLPPARDEAVVTLVWDIFTDTGQKVYSLGEEFDASPDPYTLTLSQMVSDPGFYYSKVIYNHSALDTIIRFGYDAGNIRSKAKKPADFDSFWNKTRQKLANVSPEFGMHLKDSLSNETRKVYLVEMRSLGNVLIRGWYTVPAAKGQYPGILKTQGYSSTNQPVLNRPGFAILSLNIRGHGNSRDDVNPGFPGFLTYGLDDKDSYIYRGAYMDCVRAIDFLSSRPEVDPSRIAVQGESQGGGLAFAVAALDDRIDLCVARVPFLSDFRSYVELAGTSAFIGYVNESKGSWDEVFEVLDYFDITNFVDRINVPVFMAVGLQDLVCPNQINFAAFNAVASSDKEYVVFPVTGHRMWEAIGDLDHDWIKYRFRVSD